MGVVEGEFYNESQIVEFANIPSREVLLATVCNVFNAPIASFARAVQAIVDKGEAAAE